MNLKASLKRKEKSREEGRWSVLLVKEINGLMTKGTNVQINKPVRQIITMIKDLLNPKYGAVFFAGVSNDIDCSLWPVKVLVFLSDADSMALWGMVSISDSSIDEKRCVDTIGSTQIETSSHAAGCSEARAAITSTRR